MERKKVLEVSLEILEDRSSSQMSMEFEKVQLGGCCTCSSSSSSSCA